MVRELNLSPGLPWALSSLGAGPHQPSEGKAGSRHGASTQLCPAELPVWKQLLRTSQKQFYLSDVTTFTKQAGTSLSYFSKPSPNTSCVAVALSTAQCHLQEWPRLKAFPPSPTLESKHTPEARCATDVMKCQQQQERAPSPQIPALP